MSNNRTIALIYSEQDDAMIEGGIKGWVSNFHKFLSTLMYQITRENPEIKLINESEFSAAELDDYSVIISVITSNLAKEKALMKALNAHGKEMKDQGRLVADGVSRFFKVLKRPYDPDGVLPELEDLLTYDFYLVDPLTGDPQEFTRFFGSDAERSYWMKLVDMAYDINHVLHAKDISEGGSYETIPREKTVYLASTGVDMVIQRDIIKRELIRHGYKVLPDHSLPKEVKALDRMVRDDLDRCRLSIHLVGEDYGYKPRGSELSVVDIQNRVASDHTYQMVEKNKEAKDGEKKPFSRLIWVSPDLKNVTERQKIFIEDLKSDAAALEEAEVLQISLQELKTIIREELVTGGRFNTKRDIKGLGQEKKDDKTKMIYLIADKRDVDDIDDIQSYLKDQGFNVVSPSYEGDLVDLRYIHQENLRRCDASIIYFGKATEDWIKTKLQDLLKAPGFGREKPLTAKAVYFRGEKDVDMEHYKKNKAMVLGNNGGSFNPEHLKPFLTKIES
ncbi:protein of unknown function [Ekhidna lutea]|uniref:Uncharacterized protein n=1 Tax=Ekhidna lutea TaxID=447679 RepID=A0A239GJK1_EKHLU|nr:DUF4062 domain-containing protein [Ekhidna lutea]SNS68673.1 protein of unknown function [Ekhidna lutea]